jgi:hypothetical protein
MSIQRRSAPTIAGVARQIAAFEAAYDLDTKVFLIRDFRSCNVDEDDAMEWSYLCDQLRVLREDALESMYAAGEDQVRLENFDDCPELLAA